MYDERTLILGMEELLGRFNIIRTNPQYRTIKKCSTDEICYMVNLPLDICKTITNYIKEYD